MMPHFFISYAKKDTRELAIALSDALNAVPNVTAWVDRSLKAGQSWESQIQREIKKCDYFVVLYSPDLNRHLEDESLTESYVLNEISYARYVLKKPIIPVMAQSTTPPISLTTLHYIDFTIKDLSLDDLLKAILAEVGIQSGGGKTKSLLPPPFDWCEIPQGVAAIKSSYSSILFNEKAQPHVVSAFLIAKYPVTNTQFAKFLEADGYENKQWWTEGGWTQKEQQKCTQPRYWDDENFNSPEQPVVGVSWYESLAFCVWLSDISGEKIMLPTQQQWQRAAKGDDGRMYPWGSDWDASFCNNNIGKNGISRTSPVRQYEGKGDSPYHVVDMVGNVWEWTLSQYEPFRTEDGRDIGLDEMNILRGASWKDDNLEHFLVDWLLIASGSHRSSDWGFRIALSYE